MNIYITFQENNNHKIIENWNMKYKICQGTYSNISFSNSTSLALIFTTSNYMSSISSFN